MIHTNSPIKTRRSFIKQSALAAGMLTLLNACGHGLKSLNIPVDQDAIKKLVKNFHGQIILPGNPVYEAARRTRVINSEMNKHPALIAQCNNQEDILRCIEFAHKCDLEVAVRSGNHSLLGWGTCEKGIVIDLSKIKGITIDKTKHIVQVGCGCTGEEILAATAPYGLVPVLGECGSVGAGLVLGGGLGYLSGKFGATCDTLITSQVITSNGRTLYTNDTTNQDLFWAIRGGGGSFGIATSFEYQLYELDKVLAGWLVYPINKANALLRFFRDFMSVAPDELQGDCYYVKSGEGSFEVEFVYSGDLITGESLINKFREFLKPTQDWIRQRPYAEIYQMGPDIAPHIHNIPCQFRTIKGTYIKTLSDEVISVILSQFDQAPLSCQLGFNLSHYMHGKVCRVPPNQTAFELRKAGAIDMAFLIGWNEPKKESECMSWISSTFEKLQRYSGGRIYSNYSSTNKPIDAKSVYGTNYARLVQLKRKYDPQNFFHLNQYIPSK